MPSIRANKLPSLVLASVAASACVTAAMAILSAGAFRVAEPFSGVLDAVWTVACIAGVLSLPVIVVLLPIGTLAVHAWLARRRFRTLRSAGVMMLVAVFGAAGASFLAALACLVFAQAVQAMPAEDWIGAVPRADRVWLAAGSVALVMVGTGVLMLALLRRRLSGALRAVQLRDRGRCVHCGNPWLGRERCPECGALKTPHPDLRPT